MAAAAARARARTEPPPKLLNSDHGPNLPSCWRTLHELARLTDEQFEAGVAAPFNH
jgi:hypothetical protein